VSNQSPANEIRVKQGRTELVAAGDEVRIGDEVFSLSRVDRVAYRVAKRLNQASYGIALGEGDREKRLIFEAYARGNELAEKEAIWTELVARIEAVACQRMAADAKRAIDAGETVRIGSPAMDAVDLDREGIKRHRPFAPKVAWSAIARSDLYVGTARILTHTSGTPDKNPKITIPIFGWNAVILPDIVALMTAAR
jgi:hypothetical protein